MDEFYELGGLFSTKGSAEISPVERLLNEFEAHESLGTQEKRIEIKQAGTQKVDFTFAASTGVKK